MTNGIFGEVHAPLRGATIFGTAFRWVRSLARASHRLPSRVPPARGDGVATNAFRLALVAALLLRMEARCLSRSSLLVARRKLERARPM